MCTLTVLTITLYTNIDSLGYDNLKNEDDVVDSISMYFKQVLK